MLVKVHQSYLVEFIQTIVVALREKITLCISKVLQENADEVGQINPSLNTPLH